LELSFQISLLCKILINQLRQKHIQISMEENLVIVESPAKAKTIEKFLGKNFVVRSSYGHIRDLSKKNYGIDIQNGFEPQYEIPPEKKKLVSELKKNAKTAKTVWLASDEDREGEAIAWHLFEALGLKKSNTKRIVFHEITNDAIQNAIKNPRDIDINLVNAQQARRVLDRLVGFELSEILWKKVKSSLSAGRVQSVAVRLIVEREREIIGFKTTSNFKVSAIFLVPDKNGKQIELKAELPEKMSIKGKAEEFLKNCIGAFYTIKAIETKPAKKSPTPPFTTSTLQQEASRKLGFSVSQTMTIAQKLYEEGKITYMRTDSVNLSETALSVIKEQIVNEFGEKYLHLRRYQTKTKGAQEAHEAIRPTDTSTKIVSSNSSEQRLYELIWRRTIASQMSDAQLEKTNVDISISTMDKYFVASGEVLKFDGFLKVYKESVDDETEKEQSTLLPPLKLNDKLQLNYMRATERFTHHPPRYAEASLVKKLEELGIGRPSTYAPIISTILKRGYVVKEDREGTLRNFFQLTLKDKSIKEEIKSENTGAEKSKLFPTDIAMVVTDFLVSNFNNILNYNFTADVEKDFDEIADGKLIWNKMINDFYQPFHIKVKETIEKSERNTGERILGSDPESGKTISVRIGRFGPIVQMGDVNADEESTEKKIYASLRKGQHIETISLEEALDLLKISNQGRLLGNDPSTGLPIYVRIGRYGPMAQIGETDAKDKPRYASLKKGQVIESISLEEALELFKMPRILGEFETKNISVAIGRFGPYVSHNSKFASLKKTDDPYTISLNRAIELIQEKRIADDKKLIKEFSENKDLKIIKDRWGRPCIFFKKKYVSLSKNVDAEKMTYSECLELIDIQPDKKNTRKTAIKEPKETKKVVKKKSKTTTAKAVKKK